jgi:hypothetical protein
MARGKASGYTLKNSDVPIIMGMEARGDRDHDIAAWFGVNQGRIAEAKEGKYGPGQPAPQNTLPPKGPPGVKGKRLRTALKSAIDAIEKGTTDLASVKKLLAEAAAKYDANEA